MTVFEFEIPGKPFAWRRTRGTGRARFKDRDLAAEQERIAWLAMKTEGWRDLEVWTGPIVATLVFTFKGDPKRPHTSVPDIDNLAKTVLDALNGVVYGDDAQIVGLTLVKDRGPVAHTSVRLEHRGKHGTS